MWVCACVCTCEWLQGAYCVGVHVYVPGPTCPPVRPTQLAFSLPSSYQKGFPGPLCSLLPCGWLPPACTLFSPIVSQSPPLDQGTLGVLTMSCLS